MFATGVAMPLVDKQTCLRNGMSENAWRYYTNCDSDITMGDLFTKIGAQLICDETSGSDGKKACGEHMRADVALGRLQLVLHGKRSSELGYTDVEDFNHWNTNLRNYYLTPSECETHLRALETKEGVDLLAKCKYYCCGGVKPVSAAKLALDVTGNLDEATKFVQREQALVGMGPDLEELTEEWGHRVKAHEKRKAEKKKRETEQRKAEKRERESEETDEGAKRAKASR